MFNATTLIKANRFRTLSRSAHEACVCVFIRHAVYTVQSAMCSERPPVDVVPPAPVTTSSSSSSSPSSMSMVIRRRKSLTAPGRDLTRVDLSVSRRSWTSSPTEDGTATMLSLPASDRLVRPDSWPMSSDTSRIRFRSNDSTCVQHQRLCCFSSQPLASWQRPRRVGKGAIRVGTITPT